MTATEELLIAQADQLLAAQPRTSPPEDDGLVFTYGQAQRAVIAALQANADTIERLEAEKKLAFANGFDAATLALETWADSFMGGQTPAKLRAAAADLRRNKAGIIAALATNGGGR